MQPTSTRHAPIKSALKKITMFCTTCRLQDKNKSPKPRRQKKNISQAHALHATFIIQAAPQIVHTSSCVPSSSNRWVAPATMASLVMCAPDISRRACLHGAAVQRAPGVQRSLRCNVTCLVGCYRISNKALQQSPEHWHREQIDTCMRV